jgi:hypothetical protein
MTEFVHLLFSNEIGIVFKLFKDYFNFNFHIIILLKYNPTGVNRKTEKNAFFSHDFSRTGEKKRKNGEKK